MDQGSSGEDKVGEHEKDESQDVVGANGEKEERGNKKTKLLLLLLLMISLQLKTFSKKFLFGLFTPKKIPFL